MTVSGKSWRNRVRLTVKTLFWPLLAFLLIQQACGPYRLAASRSSVLDRFQQQRKSRVIAMIHRQDTVSVLGVPVSSPIDIKDSEAILRAIRLTPQDQAIDLVLHTPGGLLLAAEQIAKALMEHKGKLTVFVPHYAMSGGTLVALAADEIVMDPNAVLGPVDPQIGDMPGKHARSRLRTDGPASAVGSWQAVGPVRTPAAGARAAWGKNRAGRSQPSPRG